MRMMLFSVSKWGELCWRFRSAITRALILVSQLEWAVIFAIYDETFAIQKYKQVDQPSHLYFIWPDSLTPSFFRFFSSNTMENGMTLIYS